METYKYVCEKCNYKHNNKLNYEQHCRTGLHLTGQRKPRADKLGIEYKCEECGYNTLNKNNYLTHKLNNHSTLADRKKEFKYYCETCDFGVFVESCYNKHTTSKNHLRRLKT